MEDGSLAKLRESLDEERAGKIRQDIARIGDVPASSGKTANGKARRKEVTHAEEDDEEDQTGAGFFE